MREEDELIFAVIALDETIAQPGVMVNPNVTEIIILDDDGNLPILDYKEELS